MVRKHKMRHGLVRVFTLTLAVLLVVVLGQALAHSHEKCENEAACHLCQAAQLGATPIPAVELLSSPLLTAGYTQPLVVKFHQELSFHDCPSRAPPAV
jgi:hypothetical protein